MERDSKGTRQRSRTVVGTMTPSSTMTTTISRMLLMRRLREHLKASEEAHCVGKGVGVV